MKQRRVVIPAVYALLKNQADEYLMIRRAGTGFNDGFYTPPSGHIDGGESFRTAAIRETKEEVGVDVSPEDMQLAFVANYMAEEGNGDERVALFFVAQKWTGEPRNAEPHKADDLGWFSLDSLPENTVGPALFALKSIASGQIYGDYGF